MRSTNAIDPEAPKREFQGVWIPEEIWDATDLSWLEKCLLASVKEAEGKDGCCDSNATIAKRFNTTAGAIANLISHCRQLGYINDVSFDGRQRRISVKS